MTMKFFYQIRMIFKYFRFFLKHHWTKIDEDREDKLTSENRCFRPKNQENFFSVEYSEGIEYSMTMKFFYQIRIIFKYFRFFFQDHWTKIDENREDKTPPKPLFWGGV